MEIVFASSKLEKQCTDIRDARKLVGGNERVALGILSRINALKQAASLRDIVIQPQFRFHNLDNQHRRKLKGYFAIDATNRRYPWRIVIQPLDENEEPFVPCNIDEISNIVEIMEVVEVSNHYE